jgi:hypothetical protein
MEHDNEYFLNNVSDDITIVRHFTTVFSKWIIYGMRDMPTLFIEHYGCIMTIILLVGIIRVEWWWI